MGSSRVIKSINNSITYDALPSNDIIRGCCVSSTHGENFPLNFWFSAIMMCRFHNSLGIVNFLLCKPTIASKMSSFSTMAARRKDLIAIPPQMWSSTTITFSVIINVIVAITICCFAKMKSVRSLIWLFVNMNLIFLVSSYWSSYSRIHIFSFQARLVKSSFTYQS